MSQDTRTIAEMVQSAQQDADVIALEKGIYNQYLLKYGSYKKAHIGRRIVPIESLELPNDSVFHIVDHLTDPGAGSILPDLKNPILMNEHYRIYFDTVLSIPTVDQDPIFGSNDKFRFVGQRFRGEAQAVFSANKLIKRMSSPKSVLGSNMVLSAFNYNATFKATIQTGQLKPYRRFMLVFRTVLSQLNKITTDYPKKYNFVYFPLSERVYQKLHFSIAFRRIDLPALKGITDYTYYLLVHFLGLLNPEAITSILTKFTDDQLKKIHFIFVIDDNCIDYNLYRLKYDICTNNIYYLQILRHINTLKLLALDKNVSEEDLNSIDDDAFETIVDNVAEPVDDNPPPETKEETPTVVVKQDVEAATSKAHDDAIIDDPIKISSLEPDEAKPMTSTAIDKIAKQVIETNVPAPQRAKVTSLAERYKTVTFGGVPAETLLDNTETPDIKQNSLEFLRDQVVDPSMLTSSIMDFDKIYVREMMNRDFAAVATSFAKSGMFLVGHEERDQIDPRNRIRYHRLIYEDVDGKRHTITVKHPIVSDDGTIFVNGIESRMIKQNVNVPICKVSETRVSLASDFNKTLVERTIAKAHSFDSMIARYIASLVANKAPITVKYGILKTDQQVPYEYACVAKRYSDLEFDQYRIRYSYEDRYRDLSEIEKDLVVSLEKDHGVFCGYCGTNYLFYGKNNHIRTIHKTTKEILKKNTILGLLYGVFKTYDEPKIVSEWTELKIQDRNFPIVFTLGYKYGLQTVLDKIKIDYKFWDNGRPIIEDPTSTLAVRFADGVLTFNRYPLEKSLVIAGLAKYNLKNVMFNDMNDPDTYFALLQKHGLSTNYLKGISAFFDLFISPITRDVLIEMGEPTTVPGLLLRATQMLSTLEHLPASSMRNHRSRGYERFNSIIYNQIARTLNTYKTQRGSSKTFSLNPEAVFLAIMKDPTIQTVENINPVHDLKSKLNATYTGHGGRTSQAFVVEDRRYPDDGVGVLSECSPDSGKVAINTYYTTDPAIKNIRGMFDLNSVDKKTIPPTKLLSPTSLLMPGSTNDD